MPNYTITTLNLPSTSEESERRTRQVELLQSKSLQMQRLFDDQVANINRDRSSLIGSDWESNNLDAIQIDPSQHSVDHLRADQRRILGGEQLFLSFP